MHIQKKERIGAIALTIGLTSGIVAAIGGLRVGSMTSNVETYLLPIFFTFVGIELRQEFATGYFIARERILAPTLGAVLGVAAPGFAYLLLADATGWAIPTATDITLGLVVLSIFGGKLGLRARFLALATLDDLIGLGIILFLFTKQVHVAEMLAAVLALLIFGITQRLRATLSRVFLFLAPLAIIATASAGVQTSVAGFLIGVLITDSMLKKAIPEVVSYFVLPVFGFSVIAGALTLPIHGFSAAVFLAVLVRPVAKILGITLGGVLGDAITGAKVVLYDWLGIGILGGIGLTVSFLLTNLSYRDPGLQISAVLGTIAATSISVVLFILYASYRARQAAK